LFAYHLKVKKSLYKILLKNYNTEPLSIIRKTQVLINGILVNFIFILIITIVHVIIPLGWLFIITDVGFLIYWIVSLFLIYKKKYEFVSMSFTFILPVVIFVELPVRDFMEYIVQPHTRFIETEILAVAGLVFISLSAYKHWQIFWFSLMSLVVIIAHFLIIIFKYHGGYFSPMAISDIIIYSVLFLIMSFMSYYRYQISEKLILGLESETIKVKNLNNSLQGQVKQRTQEINEQNQQLKKTNFELDYLVYRVSHDIRGPLVSALGLIGLIRSESEPIQQGLYLDILCELVTKLDNLIKDTIELSQNARLEVETEKIDWQNIWEEILANNQFQPNFLKVKKELILGEKAAFFSDRQRLSVILNNLISNAIKYAEVENRQAILHLSIEVDAQQVLIKVEDNGHGIAPEHQEKVFDMFYRATDRSPGSGLGLYIVKEITQKLGGKISFDSKLHKGSAFDLLLPNLKRELIP
jgi:signal transduction histidine kinase